MPQGYQTRLAEIRRLTSELEDMDRFGVILLALGPHLGEAISDVFGAMKFDIAPLAGDASRLAVKLDSKRRLLVTASAAATTIDRKHAEVAKAFSLLHEHAEPSDRVVLVTNPDPMTPPPQRAASVTAEALEFLQRLGVNVMTGPQLFSLWTIAQQEATRAQKYVERLHAQDGGMYVLPTV